MCYNNIIVKVELTNYLSNREREIIMIDLEFAKNMKETSKGLLGKIKEIPEQIIPAHETEMNEEV